MLRGLNIREIILGELIWKVMEKVEKVWRICSFDVKIAAKYYSEEFFCWMNENYSNA